MVAEPILWSTRTGSIHVCIRFLSTTDGSATSQNYSRANTMNQSTWCLGMLSILCFGQWSTAADLYSGCLGHELKCTRCAVVPFCCADDYCPKSLPCVPCLRLPTCDGRYCRKASPCLSYYHTSRRMDDYCQKPLPQLCRPTNTRPYFCSPDDNMITVPVLRKPASMQ